MAPKHPRCSSSATAAAKRAYSTPEGLVVLAGSVGKASHRPSAAASTLRKRTELIEQGVVEIKGEDFVFLQDQLFTSPSTAAAVIAGGSINGRIAWRNAAGLTFQQIEEEALIAA